MHRMLVKPDGFFYHPLAFVVDSDVLLSCLVQIKSIIMTQKTIDVNKY